MDKKLKIGLHCFDVFNKNEINGLISGTNLESNFRKKDDSRTFRISLTYNFGNLKLQKENTDIQTEKVKTGGGLVKQKLKNIKNKTQKHTFLSFI